MYKTYEVKGLVLTSRLGKKYKSIINETRKFLKSCNNFKDIKNRVNSKIIGFRNFYKVSNMSQMCGKFN